MYSHNMSIAIEIFCSESLFLVEVFNPYIIAMFEMDMA